MNEVLLPEKAMKKAEHLIRDAQLAVVVAFIPLISLIYILRLVQWYLLRNQYPAVCTDAFYDAKDFRLAVYRLWFAVMFWPVVIVGFILYFYLY
jgi:hypothetical protein